MDTGNGTGAPMYGSPVFGQNPNPEKNGFQVTGQNDPKVGFGLRDIGDNSF